MSPKKGFGRGEESMTFVPPPPVQDTKPRDSSRILEAVRGQGDVATDAVRRRGPSVFENARTEARGAEAALLEAANTKIAGEISRFFDSMEIPDGSTDFELVEDQLFAYLIASSQHIKDARTSETNQCLMTTISGVSSGRFDCDLLYDLDVQGSGAIGLKAVRIVPAR